MKRAIFLTILSGLICGLPGIAFADEESSEDYVSEATQELEAYGAGGVIIQIEKLDKALAEEKAPKPTLKKTRTYKKVNFRKRSLKYNKDYIPLNSSSAEGSRARLDKNRFEKIYESSPNY